MVPWWFNFDPHPHGATEQVGQVFNKPVAARILFQVGTIEGI